MTLKGDLCCKDFYLLPGFPMMTTWYLWWHNYRTISLTYSHILQYGNIKPWDMQLWLGNKFKSHNERTMVQRQALIDVLCWMQGVMNKNITSNELIDKFQFAIIRFLLLNYRPWHIQKYSPTYKIRILPISTCLTGSYSRPCHWASTMQDDVQMMPYI